jgi:hypothetical protein
MSARHRERYSSSPQKLSTITPEFCPRCAGISVHVDLETLSTISRNTQPIWALGSAIAGRGCFTCITGESSPTGDYEITAGR